MNSFLQIRIRFIALFFLLFSVSNVFAGIEATSTPTSSPSSSDGAIDLTISGGFAPYVILWQGPNGFTSDQEDLGGLAQGTYDVEVTDALCGIANLSVVVEPCPTSMIVGIQPIYPCAGEENGTLRISLNASGDLPLTWECRQFFSGNVITTGQISQLNPYGINLFNVEGLGAAIYTFIVRDSRGCEDSRNVILLARAV